MSEKNIFIVICIVLKISEMVTIVTKLPSCAPVLNFEIKQSEKLKFSSQNLQKLAPGHLSIQTIKKKTRGQCTASKMHTTDEQSLKKAS